MKKIILVLICLSIFFVGCQQQNVFNVKDKVNLKGDYSNSETIDFLDEPISYVPVAKIICSENEETCIMIMEIDYRQMLKIIQTKFLDCGVDTEKLEDINPNNITVEQKECLIKVAEGLGFNKPIERQE